MTELRDSRGIFLATATAIEPPAPGTGSPERRTGTRTRAALSTGIGRLGPALGLLLVVIAFALLAPEPARYLSSFNLRIVLSQTVIVALGAVGMTMIVVSGGIDLSVGAVIALTGVLTAIALLKGVPPLVAVLGGVVAGGVVGFINGTLVTKLRVVPFIVTLGMLGVARGVAKWAAHEQTVNVPSSWVSELLVTFPRPAWLLLPVGVWVTVALAALAALILSRTVFGRHIFALGSNEAAARACGIDTSRLRIATYTSAGLLFGLAGVMQLSRLRQGDPTVANGAELDIIAAVVIGGGSLSGGEGSILGSMIGALIMAFLRNGCQQMGWPNYIQEIIIGTIIVAAVALDRVRLQWAVARASLASADA
jgi:ribose transport system permease protein